MDHRLHELGLRDAIGVAAPIKALVIQSISESLGIQKELGNEVCSQVFITWANETNFRLRNSQEEVDAYLVS